MTQDSNNIKWRAGQVINAETGYVSLIRPERTSTPVAEPAAKDGFALAAAPSNIISQGDRPNSSSVVARNVPPKFRNA